MEVEYERPVAAATKNTQENASNDMHTFLSMNEE